MTNEEIMACTKPSRELDAEAAEAVGWIATGYWKPSSDIEQASQLQARIEELGLTERYILELSDIVGRQIKDHALNPFWWFVTAPAIDRTKAAILAVRKGE